MLNIVAFITPKTEYYQICKQKIAAVVDITKEEKGCIRFEVYEDEIKRQLVLVEIWENQTALDEHYAKTYISTIFDFYQNALQKAPEIHKLKSVSQ